MSRSNGHLDWLGSDRHLDSEERGLGIMIRNAAIGFLITILVLALVIAVAMTFINRM